MTSQIRTKAHSWLRLPPVVLAIVLITSPSGAEAVFCQADRTRSGCWMCPESDLMKCLRGNGGDLPDFKKCRAMTNLQERAACACRWGNIQAQCWGKGRCCTEYAPSLNAATNICAAAKFPTKYSDNKIHNLVEEVFRVANQIEHNDSGVDVPIVARIAIPSVSPQDYHPQPPPKSASDSQPVLGAQLSNKLDVGSQSTTQTVSYRKAHPEKTNQPSDKGVPVDQSKETPVYEYQRHSQVFHGDSQHHHARLSQVHKGKAKDCDTDEEKYKKAAHSKHKTRLSKRELRPRSDHVKHVYHVRSMDLWHLTQKCGVDFHGVKYPSSADADLLNSLI